MTRWTKLMSIALIAVVAAGLFGGAVVRADDGTATPNPPEPGRGKIIRVLAPALLDATVAATKLQKSDILKQLGDGKTLSDVITANGATVETVKADAKATITAQAQQAVTDGKLTQDQETKLLGRLDQALDRLLTAKFPAQQTPIARQLHNLGYSLLVKETSAQTNIPQRDLLKSLRDGKTLAQIAADNKIDPAVIVTAAVQKATDRINALVKNGKLKDDEAKTLIGGLQSALTKMMSEPAPARGRQGKGSQGNGLGAGLGDDVSTPDPVGTPGL